MKPWALVTGASRGIGAAIATELAAGGYPIIANYHSNHTAAESLKERIEQAGGTVMLAPFDVADQEEVGKAQEQFLSEEREIGIVINNAGVARDNPFPAVSAADWKEVTRTSLDGFYNVTQPLVMPMVRRRWGRIVSLTSVSGLVGNRGQVAYSAAKAGLIGATRSLALEVARRGVTVNAVAPGLIETDMIKNAPVDELVKIIPMRRLGQAHEVAKLVAFLVGDDAAYITGQTISVNGGLS